MGTSKPDTRRPVKSTFQLFQDKINEQIREYEAENVAAKPWTMTGEVSSKKRPMNSLLEEVVEFDQTIKVTYLLAFYFSIYIAPYLACAYYNARGY
jgi:U3 small nucleolar ribonucleoprotein component